MNELHLTVSQLRGLILASGKADIRYYLNGTLFDFENSRAVSTDGSCLLAINTPATFDDAAYAQAIAPRDVLEAVAKGGKVDTLVKISRNKSGLTLERSDQEVATTCQPIDGTYPDYMHVMPKKFDNAPAAFNPELLARISKALRLALEAKDLAVYFSQNGENPALLSIAGRSSEAIAVVMPLRMPKGYNHGAELAAFTSVSLAKNQAA